MSAIPATPKLVPVFSMKLQLLGAPQALFTDSSKKAVSNMAIVATGQITTIKNDLGFELDVFDMAGYDNITAHLEKGYNELDAHIHGKTSAGEDIRVDYYGISQSLPGLDAVLAGKATSHSFEDSYLTNSPRFSFTAPPPENLKWLEKENLIGKGHFLVEDEKVFVEYFVYVVR
ncbi:hypothetical protein METBIDRAFT_40579 [Metschnikowia bicuspidata var. bicuspidata NRRL YB-4993]|uniref:Uncharacterized protein n=1 Tax=Metschnikowia bicuspidata var. bicuspidata NRRL YB-4993 TaxID=869754 RepID=A0A1A0HET5_9ASCO|nr:hypothetical protein METBIDRAFT_40579 [Metschnikowia bicuspidata var. bicuspidata NRRL YB-4993]OBA22485.1 hypothetical protein METBIDRAFT_40579 [Metschnikowia bicuspidata var. bicuspidata NRRL YB-4993]